MVFKNLPIASDWPKAITIQRFSISNEPDIKASRFWFCTNPCNLMMKALLCSFIIRRQDENSLLTLHCLTTGHAFDWTRSSVVGNGSTKRTREFTGAWKTTLTCVHQGTSIDLCYKALRAYWKRESTYSQAVCLSPSFSMLIIFLTRPLKSGFA